MKQTNKLKMIASMAICVIVAIFAASCSNDAFFGFDDSYSSVVFNNTLSIQYDTYLDWDYTGILADASEEDKMIYFEAMQRCNYCYQNGYLITNVNKAQDVNISESLFNYIQERVNESNRSFSLFTSQTKIQRYKNGNREEGDVIYNNLNCSCFALAYIKSKRNSLTYDASLRVSVNAALIQEFDTTYTNGNLLTTDLPRAASVCDIAGGLALESGHVKLNKNVYGVWSQYIGMEHNVPIGHALVFIKIERIGVSGDYKLYWADPATGSFNTTPFQVNDNYFPIRIDTPSGAHRYINSIYK